MFFVILVSFLLANAQAQIPGPPDCDQRIPMTDFNPSKFLGQWYDYARYPDGLPYARCARTEYIGGDNGTMFISLKGISTIPDTFIVRQSQGLEGRFIANSTFVITQPEDSSFFNTTTTIYGTDYVSYMVDGTCSMVGSYSMNYVWIRTRSPNPPQSVVAEIAEVLRHQNLQTQYLTYFNQTDCSFEY